jgi:hypothetical protein
VDGYAFTLSQVLGWAGRYDIMVDCTMLGCLFYVSHAALLLHLIQHDGLKSQVLKGIGFTIKLPLQGLQRAGILS